MHARLPSPVRSWEARRALRAERRRADEELLASRLASPRLAWRVAELVADANRIEIGRSLTAVAHSADERLLPAASPVDRGVVRECRAALLELASRLCDLDAAVHPRGVLLTERLLRDGAVYAPTSTERLRGELDRCLDEL
jgi:hypothetical protein